MLQAPFDKFRANLNSLNSNDSDFEKAASFKEIMRVKEVWVTLLFYGFVCIQSAGLQAVIPLWVSLLFLYCFVFFCVCKV